MIIIIWPSKGSTCVFIKYECAFLNVDPYSSPSPVAMIAWTANDVSQDWLPLYPYNMATDNLYIIRRKENRTYKWPTPV